MNTKKSIILTMALIIFVSLITFNTYSEGLGCCYDPNGCSPASDISQCPSGTFSTESCDSPALENFCQEGCCVCSNSQGEMVKAEYTQYKVKCNADNNETGICYGLTQANFNPSLSPEQCTMAAPSNISGYVLEQDSLNIAIPYAQVTLAGQSITADQNGKYSFLNIASGTHTITASKLPDYEVKSIPIDISPEITLDYNIFLIPSTGPITTGTIKGTIRNSNNQPISEATVLLDPYSITKTNANGFYEFTKLRLTDYNVVAYKEGYSQTTASTKLSVDSHTAIIDLNINPLITGTITGTAKDTNGAVITDVAIYVDGNFKALTSAQGTYTISEIETGSHLVYAEKIGYKRSSLTSSIQQGSNNINFILEQGNLECNWPEKPGVSQITADHIPGVEAISLSWSEACNELSGYFLIRTQGTKKKTIFFPKIGQTQTLSYIDFDVEWSKSYDYKVIAAYTDTEVRNSSASPTTQITTGDLECENKFSLGLGEFTEFCDQELRLTCNEENKLQYAIETRNSQYLPSDCSKFNEQGKTFICAGPDIQGLTDCKQTGVCSPIAQSANPFGLFYNEQACYGLEDENFCYYDYSETIVDSCYSCEQNTTCYDYNSENACEKDNCVATNCFWEPTIYSELGKGICYEEDYNETDECERCSEDNFLFENNGCTQDICSLLGNCYADETDSNCLGCVDCESLSTEEQCTDGEEFSIGPSPSCSLSFTKSDDNCNLGKCKWNTPQGESAPRCFKDGDDNNIPDCTGAPSCRSDVTPPTTKPEDKILKINTLNGINFLSDEDAKTLVFCVDDDNTCCPATSLSYPILEGKIHVPSEELINSYPNMIDGTYYIRYYSIDSHNNQELVKSTSFASDVKPPEITIDLRITEGSCEQDSSLFLNISTSEYAHCKDLLKQTRGVNTEENRSILQESLLGLDWNAQYTTKDGGYKYTVTCTDNSGNVASKSINIDVDACWLVDILKPDGPIKDTDVSFEIATRDSAVCELLINNVSSGTFGSSASHTSHTIIQNSLEQNKHYKYYAARCTNLYDTSQVDTEGFSFTIDLLPPLTSTVINTSQTQFSINYSEWDIYSKGDLNITLNCIDELERSFGCDTTKHCTTTNTYTSCTPTETTQPPKITETTNLCYYSIDKGENTEQTKCGTIHIGEGSGITMINPHYNVSNIPIFDVLIETSDPSDLCKYAVGNFDFNNIQSSENIFEKVSDTVHVIRDFDKAGLNNPYPMSIKCKYPNGFITPQPANFLLEYIPFPPTIEENKTIPSTVTQGNFVELYVRTDQQTICKYSKSQTIYSLMNGKFPGWNEYDSGNANFNYTHKKAIALSTEDDGKDHYYYVSCKSRAGNVSSTEQITFSVDFSQFGQITSTSPSGSTRDTQVQLKATTSKDAVCQYQQEGQWLPLGNNQPKTAHEAPEMTLIEGIYNFPLKCEFSAPYVSREGAINFIVDLSDPVMKNIDDGNYSCDGRIYPQFEAEDELSPISQYNYSVYKSSSNNQKLNWKISASSNPRVNIDNLTEGEKYYFKASAIDAAENQGNTITSDGFIALPDNATECKDDGIGPNVTIRQELTYKGIKITILCSDNTGCADKYYGIKNSEESCDTPNTYSSPAYITETSKFCWEAYDVTGNFAQGSLMINVTDSDEDGVPDKYDKCPNTKSGKLVDHEGCSDDQRLKDQDRDGVPDERDICPETPANEIDLIDADGCAPSERDSDKDKVKDITDKCPNTPYGEEVDLEGCSNSQKFSCGDSIDDAWRKRFFGSILCTGEGAPDADPDKDGLSNLQEYNYYKSTTRMIDPKLKDTDSDKYSDKDEIDEETNPVDANDFPGKIKIFPLILLILGILLFLFGASYRTYIYYTEQKRPKRPQPPSQPFGVKTPEQTKRETFVRKVAQQKRILEIRRMKGQEARRKAAIEHLHKAMELKHAKRRRFLDAFGNKKSEEKTEKIEKTINIPKEPEKIEKLTKLTEEHITQNKPIGELSPIPEVKKQEFEKLTEFIEERIKIPKTGRPKQLTEEQKRKIKDIFQQLSLLTQVREKKKELLKQIQKTTMVEKTKEKFISSSTAKRYHKANCPFAQNISEERRVYLTEEQIKKSKKLPCSCVTGKKLPRKTNKKPKTKTKTTTQKTITTTKTKTKKTKNKTTKITKIKKK